MALGEVMPCPKCRREIANDRAYTIGQREPKTPPPAVPCPGCQTPLMICVPIFYVPPYGWFWADAIPRRGDDGEP